GTPQSGHARLVIVNSPTRVVNAASTLHPCERRQRRTSWLSPSAAISGSAPHWISDSVLPRHVTRSTLSRGRRPLLVAAFGLDFVLTPGSGSGSAARGALTSRTGLATSSIADPFGQRIGVSPRACAAPIGHDSHAAA